MCDSKRGLSFYHFDSLALATVPAIDLHPKSTPVVLKLFQGGTLLAVAYDGKFFFIPNNIASHIFSASVRVIDLTLGTQSEDLAIDIPCGKLAVMLDFVPVSTVFFFLSF